MTTRMKIRTAAALIALAAAAAGCGTEARQETEPAHGASSVHDHEEDAVTLSTDAIRLAGIRIGEISLARIPRTIELPGQIGYNEERLARITPRYAGVIREIRARLGSEVRRGETLAVVESNASLSPYAIEAPIAGRVVELGAAIGEFAAEDRTLFVIADLSTVWADCAVFADDLPSAEKGLPMTIRAVGSEASIEARIDYVSSALDPETRSAIARAVIPGGGPWRPGALIRGVVRIPAGEPVPAVERDAVQLLGGEPVIFVVGDEPGEFRPVAVKTGRRDGTLVELLEGPPLGAKYVREGAFDIKAEIVTREAGAHAGHGH